MSKRQKAEHLLHSQSTTADGAAASADADTSVMAGNSDASSLRTTPQAIYLNREWFVEIDDEGYVTRSDEGTLGCVLQLRTADDDGPRLALKIPRLLADTIKENAYICELTHDEANNVRRAHRSGHDGLLPSELLDSKLLALRRATLQSDGEAQNGHVVFIQFDKRFRPRLCAVDYRTTSGGRELSVCPPALQAEMNSLITSATWDSLRAAGQRVLGMPHQEFGSPIFVKPDNGEKRLGSLGEEMNLDDVVRPWFAGLPSITFTWAEGTLQQALGTKAICAWTLPKFFKLFDRIMEGVQTLHKKGLLHCDIRPANVMAVGALHEPSFYFLGDYGSFSVDKARVGSASSGHTMIGPGVGNTRVTPFYSEERRKGVERETADTAIIIRRKHSDGEEYLVRLGWSAELFKRPDGTIDERKIVTNVIRDAIVNAATDINDHPIGNDELLPGDRLRVRDYVFELKGVKPVESQGLIAVCEKRFAHILHDKLAVYDQEIQVAGQRQCGIRDRTVISLPSFTEYRQWSAATDLYSVGAISIYCLFYTAQQHTYSEAVTEHSIGIKFAEMLDILESIPYFQSFWEDLSRFYATIQEVVKQNERRPITMNEAGTWRVVGRDTVSLVTFAVEAVNNIVQSAPHVRVLLEQFRIGSDAEQLRPSDVSGGDTGAARVSDIDQATTRGSSHVYFNAAAFLLFMHFVMGCLHRRSHVQPTRNVSGEHDDPAPFCVNRIEMPPSIEGGKRVEVVDVERLAITKARACLEMVARLLEKDWMKVFAVNEQQIAEFSPRNEFNIRLERTAWMNKARKALDLDGGILGVRDQQKRELEELAREMVTTQDGELENPNT